MQDFSMIIGLGNPGRQYANTRHNAGFMAVHRLALEHGIQQTLDAKFKAEIGLWHANEQTIVLVNPTTFMNLSGKAVAMVRDFYKIPDNQIFVIHDDLDFPLGEFKFAFDSGSAGHNGVASIIEELGTSKFWRLRIGIATESYKEAKATKNSPARSALIDQFVLGEFSPQERIELLATTDTGVKEVLSHLNLI